MFNDIADEVFIDQAFPLLAGIHQDFFTDPVDPDAGIPVGKRLSADRAVGYGAALNKKYHFRDCK